MLAETGGEGSPEEGTFQEGTLLAAYTWGDTLISQTREEKTSTYLYDGHGDVRGLLDGEGALTDTYSYNAYGELTEKTGETENHYLYTGEYYDGMPGLYYLRARYMNPDTGMFISMDTYQGNLYEPVTLHKYLYANANPVKYTDPSGMFSLTECNIVNKISAEMYESRYAILAMSLLDGIGKSAMTAMNGGDLDDVTMALLVGMVEGAGAGMIFCVVAAITVTSMAAVVSAVVAVNSIISIVMAVRSVMDGDYMEALVYGALAVVGIIGVCRWYKASYCVTVTGDKGIARFSGLGSNEPNSIIVTEDVVRDAMQDAPLQTQQSSVSLPVIQNYVDRILVGETNMPPIKVDSNIIVDGNHRYIASRITDMPVDVIPWSGGNPSKTISWMDVILDIVDWGNR